MKRLGILLAILVGVTVLYVSQQPSAEDMAEIKVPAAEEFEMKDRYEVATFGAGCFWGVEAAFRRVDGVKKTEVGFMGGNIKNPSYKEVCYTETGHVEVVHVTYDPNDVSYLALLKTFFDAHNPTQLNYQGPDIGSQYRSVIFYHNDEQQREADEVIKKLEDSKLFKGPIVTTVEPAQEFYMAEDYHQQYYEKKGVAGHCGFGTGADLSFLLEDVQK